MNAPMKGFDPKFVDFPDYIIGITKEIWEDRGIATLHDYYAPEIVVRSPASVVVGNQDVIGATMATLAEFPDRTLFGEDVIWSGTPEAGMLSSHRLHSTATHAYPGVYGVPTGKQLHYHILADCHAIDNQINDEWLIRDQGAIVRQLGWEPKDFARDLIAREGGPEACVQPLTPANDVVGPYKGTGNDNEWGQRHADILTRIMSADFTVVPEAYDRGANLSYPGGLETLSFDGADRFWMGLRAAFPNATFTIHHTIGREDPMMPPRSAIRWSLHGKHEGWGHSVRQRVQMSMCSASATPNSEHWLAGHRSCVANGPCSMKPRSGSRSCSRPETCNVRAFSGNAPPPRLSGKLAGATAEPAAAGAGGFHPLTSIEIQEQSHDTSGNRKTHRPLRRSATL